MGVDTDRKDCVGEGRNRRGAGMSMLVGWGPRWEAHVDLKRSLVIMTHEEGLMGVIGNDEECWCARDEQNIKRLGNLLSRKKSHPAGGATTRPQHQTDHIEKETGARR